MPAMSITSAAVRVKVLAALSLARSMMSMPSMRLLPSGPPAPTFLMALRSRLPPPWASCKVSMPLPPDTRAKRPVLPPAPSTACKAAMLLALMMRVSLPAPACMTSAPPLPVRVSLPWPPAKVSPALVPAWASAPVPPMKSMLLPKKAPLVLPKMT